MSINPVILEEDVLTLPRLNALLDTLEQMGREVFPVEAVDAPPSLLLKSGENALHLHYRMVSDSIASLHLTGAMPLPADCPLLTAADLCRQCRENGSGVGAELDEEAAVINLWAALPEGEAPTSPELLNLFLTLFETVWEELASALQPD